MAKPSKRLLAIMDQSEKDAINIKPSHKGMLTKKVGKKGLSVKNLANEKTKAKKSGNVKLEREIVFAQNEKKWKKR